jgi:uncharacterized protein YjhX (UPF0386 family)
MEVRNQLHTPVALTQGKHLPENRYGLNAVAKTTCLNQQGNAVFECTVVSLLTELTRLAV